MDYRDYLEAMIAQEKEALSNAQENNCSKAILTSIERRLNDAVNDLKQWDSLDNTESRS